LLNHQKIEDKENCKPETLNPKFYKLYELKGVLPSDFELIIEVWDRDIVEKDEIIGSTTYDLQNLYFSEQFREMQKDTKLIVKEARQLKNHVSSSPQGEIIMWLEMLTPDEAQKRPAMKIGPPDPEEFELRVVVWETRDCVPKDFILGKASADIKVTANLLNHPDGKKTTDTHSNVMDKCGKLNWRLVWRSINLPYDGEARLKVQIWDDDPLADDSIAEANLSLNGFFKKAYKKKGAHLGGMAGVNRTGQWLDVFHPNFEGVQGAVCLEIDLLPKAQAEARKAGDARSEPNAFPYLPEPVRPKRKWLADFADFTHLGKLKKYAIICCICLVIALIIYLAILFH